MIVIRSLLGLSLIGTTLFGAAWLTAMSRPGIVEAWAKELIRLQVEAQVNEKIAALDDKFLASKAGEWVSKHANDAAVVRQRLQDKVPERIAAVIAEMRNLDCECRKKIENRLREGYQSRIDRALQAQDRLTLLIRTKYLETAEKLTREFRIFTGTNALVFALLGIAAWRKRQAGWHLLPPVLTLVLAALISGYLYLFNQNWLHTLVFSDYVGFSYVLYLSLVFAWLCDVIFNRAKVTTWVLSNLGGSLQPC